MEKQKRWQFYLILAVIILTIYNILPTIFYYAHPLREPIDAARSEQVAQGIVERVNALEEDSQEWLWSFAKLLHVKPTSIQAKANDPRLIEVSFSNEHDASLFKKFLPRAGRQIPFVPAQLEVYPNPADADPSKVYVARQISVKLDPTETGSLFHYTPRKDKEGNTPALYKNIVYDRTAQIALGFAGISKTAQQAAAIAQSKDAATR